MKNTLPHERNICGFGTAIFTMRNLIVSLLLRGRHRECVKPRQYQDTVTVN